MMRAPDQGLVRLLPMLTTLAAVILDLMPGPRGWSPLLVLASVYYWTLHRPTLVPPIALCGLGCLADASGGVLGVTSLALLVGTAPVRPARRWLLGCPFPVVWACFLPVAALATLVRWGTLSLVAGRTLPLADARNEALATFLVLPLMAAALDAARRRLERSPRAAARG